MSNKKVLLCVPSYECLGFTKLCISSLLEGNESDIFDILIVENNSTNEEIRTYLKSINNKVKIIFNDVNMGFPGAINQGIDIFVENSNYEWFGILNNDLVFPKNWINKLLNVGKNEDIISPMDNNHLCVKYGHDKFPYQLLLDKKLPQGSYLKTINEQELQKILVDIYNNFEESTNNICNTYKDDFNEGASFSCCLINKNVIDKVGYMNESFYPTMVDDYDFYLRCKKYDLKAKQFGCSYFHHWCSITTNKSTLMSGNKTQKQNYEKYNNMVNKNLNCLRNSCLYNNKGMCEKGLTTHYLPINKCKEYKLDCNYPTKEK